MSINNNLRDQLQWLEKEGSKARYTGFTKYVIPENGKLGSASISYPKDNRNKVFDFESIYSTLSGSNVIRDKRANCSAIATLGALGNMDREVFFTSDLQQGTTSSKISIIQAGSSNQVRGANSAPNRNLENRSMVISNPSEYGGSKPSDGIITQLPSNMQTEISRNSNKDLNASLQSELDEINARIKSLLDNRSPEGVALRKSLKAKREEIEDRITELQYAAVAPNNSIISSDIPQASVNDISDNDLLEALRLHEEREAAKNSGVGMLPQQSTHFMSNGMSSFSHSSHKDFTPLPHKQRSDAFPVDTSVIKNGATYHKSLTPAINSRDNGSNYANDNYSYSADNFQVSNNYNSSVNSSKQAPAADYNLSVSSPYTTSSYFPPVHSSNADVTCHCGLPCILLTSRQEGSMDQKFYACPKGRTDDGNCRFFQWEKPTERNFTTSSGPIFDSTRQLSNKNHKTELFHRFGHVNYRLGQLECVEAALQGRDVFCLMPTGGGKSVVYQLPAWCCPGIAVVFSPLISLIQDQVEAMNAIKIRAVMSSSGSHDDFMEVIRELSGYISDNRTILDAGRSAEMDHKNIKMLYITPEKFNKSSHMQNLLQKLSNSGLLSRFVIDEAHCLSQWGHDFRPDYLALSKLRPLCPNVPIMCLTATANQDVVNDCIKIMKLNNPFRHSQSFNRENLHYFVKKKTKTVMQDIAAYVTKQKSQTGIIYCLSKKDTEEVCESLKRNIPDMKKQITFYHADVDAPVREERQRLWSSGVIKVICATIAFGMGINKPDVRYVIHHSLPKSLTNYYQESGRAGRDGKKAECLLFFSMSDKQKLVNMIEKSAEERVQGPLSADTRRQTIENLNKCTAFCMNSAECRRVMLLTYFGESFPKERCNATCDNCQHPQRDLQQVDMTQHGVTLVEIVRRIIEKFGDSRLTVVKLSKLYARSKDKDCKLFESSIDDLLVDKNMTLKIDLGKSLIQEMLTLGYLAEKSAASFNGFSASYVIIGPNANQLLYNDAVIKLTLRQGPKSKSASDKSAKKSSNRDRSIELDGDADRLFEESSDGEIFNAPSPPLRPVATTKQPSTKTTKKKAKKNIYTLIDDAVDAASTRSRPVISLDSDDEGGYDSHVENRGANLSSISTVSALSKPSELRPEKKRFRSPDLSSDVYSPPYANPLPRQSRNLNDSAPTYVIPPTQPLLPSEFDPSPIYMDVDSQPRRSHKRPNDEIYETNADASSAARESSSVPIRPAALLSTKQKRAFTAWMDAYKRRFLKYWQIFGTDTIPEIVRLVPLSVEEVVKIPGMGEVKGRAYGVEIVATVYSFLDKNDLLHLFPQAQPPTIADSMEWSDPIKHWESKDNEEQMSRQKDQGDMEYGHSSRWDSDSHPRHVDDFFSSQAHVLEPPRDLLSANGARQSAQFGRGVPDHHSQDRNNAPQKVDIDDDDYHYSIDDEISASNFLI